MLQEQELRAPADTHYTAPQQNGAVPLRISLLLGTGLTVIFVLLEAGLLLLLNPFRALGDGSNRFSSLLGLPLHVPAVLLVLPVQFLLFALCAFLLVKPGALIFYLRRARRAQEPYARTYMQLETSANTRRVPDEHEQDAGTSAVSKLEERVSLLDLVQCEDTHQLILGAPGSGKTTALRVYQYRILQQPLDAVFKRNRIPVYVPMEHYSLYLKKVQPVPTGEEAGDAINEPEGTLLDFLYESDLPGMHMLRPYLYQLSQQGRLLLLCDGLNEVDSAYLAQVCRELVSLARETANRLVITGRMVDYRRQRELVQLVDDGSAERIVVYPLQPEQISSFVETYVTNQGKQWRHTAGQIMQVIERSRLRHQCSNPMLLITLLSVIDSIGVERGKQIDTRSRLLREAVRQRIVSERAAWNGEAPREHEVVRFLSEVACAARRANDLAAIQLRLSALVAGGVARGRPNFTELAEALRVWLDEHPGAFTDGENDPLPYGDMAQLLQLALGAELIEISSDNVLSFRHELIAEYFAALFFMANKKHTADQMPGELREDLLERVEIWSGPVALWAGLQDDPLALAERINAAGRATPAYALQALALALICVGVQWTPPRADVQDVVQLPSGVEESLSIAVRSQGTCEELARIFTRCAEEGGQEIYYSLLPLIMVEGLDNLLVLLDRRVVAELLFTHLLDAVNNATYEAQVKRLVRVLARFGGGVVERAASLSQPGPERSIRLRAAACNILGGISDSQAVEPLLSRLDDAEPFIAERSVNSLIRLGPALALAGVLGELEKRGATPQAGRVHRACLIILERFLDEPQRRATPQQYQRILATIVSVLTATYLPEIQQQALQILVRQFRDGSEIEAQGEKQIIETLAYSLPSQDEVAARNSMHTLQSIGMPATPSLLLLLDQSSDPMRARLVEIFKTVHDLRALPRLLLLVGDPAPSIQQQTAQVLRLYAPESVPGLINLVLSDASDTLAERAAQILNSIGEAVVEPIAGVLSNAVPERMRLLVQVLEQIHDARALPALIALLQMPQLETLLAIAVVHALSQFADARVVLPLLAVLSSTNPMLYEEGINALSQFGGLAFAELVAALDVQQPSVVTQRVQRALLGMTPFPGEQLLQVLERASEQQAQQILAIFKMQGVEAAQVLVAHLRDRDEHIRAYVFQTLNDMPGPVVVPALLEVLNQAALRNVVNSILLRYPESALSPLIELLGEQERGDAAAAILPRFGMRVLRPLISGLDDQRVAARERAQRILIALVRQSAEEMLREVVHLFNPPLPAGAREALLGVLTNELADISTPALLEGLQDAYLIEDVAEAFARLSSKSGMHEGVLDVLIQQLSVDERRRGAETTLVRIGAPAVPRVGELIASPDSSIAGAAKQIMRDIGVPALPFIWSAHSDKNNPERRAAALEVFHSMPTDVIKDELVALLVSNRPEDIAMAVSLLLDRIHDESQQFYADRVMVPELITYVQTHGVEETTLRVIALLLLLGEHAIVDHLVQSLDDDLQHRQQLTYIPLLLGTETQGALLEVFNDPDASSELRAELGAILGMMVAPDEVVEAAQSLSTYGLSASSNDVLFPDQMAICLRALGGLLAGGHWNARTLHEMREDSKEGSATHELFSVLLGWRYEPQLRKLAAELQAQKDAYKREVMAITARIVAEQSRAIALEDELEKAKREHGFSSDELEKAKREREALRAGVEQSAKEKQALRSRMEQAVKEKNTASARLNQVLQERNALQEKYQDLIKRIKQSEDR